MRLRKSKQNPRQECTDKSAALVAGQPAGIERFPVFLPRTFSVEVVWRGLFPESTVEFECRRDDEFRSSQAVSSTAAVQSTRSATSGPSSPAVRFDYEVSRQKN